MGLAAAAAGPADPELRGQVEEPGRNVASSRAVCIYMYIYIYICMYVYIYIYIYILQRFYVSTMVYFNVEM